MSEVFWIVGEKLRFAWAAVIIATVYGFTMLSLALLTGVYGRPRAYHRTMWILEHLTEWFSGTGRHRKAEVQAISGEKKAIQP